jgi:hypothetical protein
MHHYYKVKYIGQLSGEAFELIIVPETCNNRKIFKVAYNTYCAEFTIYFDIEKAKDHVKKHIIETVNYYLKKNIFKEEPLLEILSNIEKHGVDFYET